MSSSPSFSSPSHSHPNLSLHQLRFSHAFQRDYWRSVYNAQLLERREGSHVLSSFYSLLWCKTPDAILNHSAQTAFTKKFERLLQLHTIQSSCYHTQLTQLPLDQQQVMHIAHLFILPHTICYRGCVPSSSSVFVGAEAGSRGSSASERAPSNVQPLTLTHLSLIKCLSSVLSQEELHELAGLSSVSFTASSWYFSQLSSPPNYEILRRHRDVTWARHVKHIQKVFKQTGEPNNAAHRNGSKTADSSSLVATLSVVSPSLPHSSVFHLSARQLSAFTRALTLCDEQLNTLSAEQQQQRQHELALHDAARRRERVRVALYEGLMPELDIVPHFNARSNTLDHTKNVQNIKHKQRVHKLDTITPINEMKHSGNSSHSPSPYQFILQHFITPGPHNELLMVEWRELPMRDHEADLQHHTEYEEMKQWSEAEVSGARLKQSRTTCSISRLVNTHSLSDSSLSTFERACCFSYSNVAPAVINSKVLTGVLSTRLSYICDLIAQHISLISSSNLRVHDMRVYFKLDSEQNVYLLHCDRLIYWHELQHDIQRTITVKQPKKQQMQQEANSTLITQSCVATPCVDTSAATSSNSASPVYAIQVDSNPISIPATKPLSTSNSVSLSPAVSRSPSPAPHPTSSRSRSPLLSAHKLHSHHEGAVSKSTTPRIASSRSGALSSSLQSSAADSSTRFPSPPLLSISVIDSTTESHSLQHSAAAASDESDTSDQEELQHRRTAATMRELLSPTLESNQLDDNSPAPVRSKWADEVMQEFAQKKAEERKHFKQQEKEYLADRANRRMKYLGAPSSSATPSVQSAASTARRVESGADTVKPNALSPTSSATSPLSNTRQLARRPSTLTSNSFMRKQISQSDMPVIQSAAHRSAWESQSLSDSQKAKVQHHAAKQKKQQMKLHSYVETGPTSSPADGPSSIRPASALSTSKRPKSAHSTILHRSHQRSGSTSSLNNLYHHHFSLPIASTSLLSSPSAIALSSHLACQGSVDERSFTDVHSRSSLAFARLPAGNDELEQQQDSSSHQHSTDTFMTATDISPRTAAQQSASMQSLASSPQPASNSSYFTCPKCRLSFQISSIHSAFVFDVVSEYDRLCRFLSQHAQLKLAFPNKTHQQQTINAYNDLQQYQLHGQVIPPTIKFIFPNLTDEEYMRMKEDDAFLQSTIDVCEDCYDLLQPTLTRAALPVSDSTGCVSSCASSGHTTSAAPSAGAQSAGTHEVLTHADICQRQVDREQHALEEERQHDDASYSSSRVNIVPDEIQNLNTATMELMAQIPYSKTEQLELEEKQRSEINQVLYPSTPLHVKLSKKFRSRLSLNRSCSRASVASPLSPVNEPVSPSSSSSSPSTLSTERSHAQHQHYDNAATSKRASTQQPTLYSDGKRVNLSIFFHHPKRSSTQSNSASSSSGVRINSQIKSAVSTRNLFMKERKCHSSIVMSPVASPLSPSPSPVLPVDELRPSSCLTSYSNTLPDNVASPQSFSVQHAHRRQQFESCVEQVLQHSVEQRTHGGDADMPASVLSPPSRSSSAAASSGPRSLTASSMLYSQLSQQRHLIKCAQSALPPNASVTVSAQQPRTSATQPHILSSKFELPIQDGYFQEIQHKVQTKESRKWRK